MMCTVPRKIKINFMMILHGEKVNKINQVVTFVCLNLTSNKVVNTADHRMGLESVLLILNLKIEPN